MSAQETSNVQSAPHVATDVARHHIACNLCGSLENEPFCPENERGLVKCKHCGLVFVSPRPDPAELYSLYGETYFRSPDSGAVGYSDYIQDETNIRKTFNLRLRWLEKHIQPGRVLDVGCAAGFFLSEAQKRGWQPEGLDISSFAVDYARSRFNLPVRQGSFTELDFAPAAYDLITMWDVIEHVPDPMQNIIRAAELLRPGGVIALATPDVDSLPARITGKRWVGYKLSEEHVYYFSTRTLSAMLQKAGFEVVEARHIGKFVTMRLFLDRLSMYTPLLAKFGQWLERRFRFSEKSAYINPYDIVMVVARKK